MRFLPIPPSVNKKGIISVLISIGVLLICVLLGLIHRLNEIVNNKLSQALNWTIDRLASKQRRR